MTNFPYCDSGSSLGAGNVEGRYAGRQRPLRQDPDATDRGDIVDDAVTAAVVYTAISSLENE